MSNKRDFLEVIQEMDKLEDDHHVFCELVASLREVYSDELLVDRWTDMMYGDLEE